MFKSRSLTPHTSLICHKQSCSELGRKRWCKAIFQMKWKVIIYSLWFKPPTPLVLQRKKVRDTKINGIACYCRRHGDWNRRLHRDQWAASPQALCGETHRCRRPQHLHLLSTGGWGWKHATFPKGVLLIHVDLAFVPCMSWCELCAWVGGLCAVCFEAWFQLYGNWCGYPSVNPHIMASCRFKVKVELVFKCIYVRGYGFMHYSLFLSVSIQMESLL